MTAVGVREIDSLSIQLTNLLSLRLDEDVNTDDVVFATFDYARRAHVIAQAMFAGRRFHEVQQCLQLCRAALEGIRLGCAAAAPTAALAPVSKKSVLSAVTSAPFMAGDTSSVFSEKAASSTIEGSYPSLYQSAVSNSRRTSLVLRSDEDCRTFSALTDRTTQLQKRLETTMQAGWDRDNDCFPQTLSQASRDDRDEGRGKNRRSGSIDMLRCQLQRLPRPAPMTLRPIPRVSDSEQDGCAQVPNAVCSLPRAARPSPFAGSEHATTSPGFFPVSSVWGLSSRAHQEGAYPVLENLPSFLPPPSLSPVRDRASGGQSFARCCNAGARLLPLATSGRSPSRSTHASFFAVAAAPSPQSQPQPMGVQPGFGVKVRGIADNEASRGGGQPHGTLPQEDAPLYSGNNYAGRSQAGESDSHRSPPARSSLTPAGAPTPQRCELSISTSTTGTGSSAVNTVTSSVLPELKGVAGLLEDDTHTAPNASFASLMTPRREYPADPSAASVHIVLRSGPTAGGPLPPLTESSGAASTASVAAVNTARAVHAARQTVLFAKDSLKEQQQRCAQTLVQCNEATFSRLPFCTREVLMRSGVEPTLSAHLNMERGAGGDYDESSVRITSPTAGGTSPQPNRSISSADETEKRASPLLLSSVDTSMASAAAVAGPLKQISANALHQLHELRSVCEKRLTASESHAKEMRLLWRLLDSRRELCAVCPHVCDIVECDTCDSLRCQQRRVLDVSEKSHAPEEGPLPLRSAPTAPDTTTTAAVTTAALLLPSNWCSGSQGDRGTRCVPADDIHNITPPVAATTSFQIPSASDTLSALVKKVDTHQPFVSDFSALPSPRPHFHKKSLDASGGVPVELDEPPCVSPREDDESKIPSSPERCGSSTRRPNSALAQPPVEAAIPVETTVGSPDAAIDAVSSVGMAVTNDLGGEGGRLLDIAGRTQPAFTDCSSKSHTPHGKAQASLRTREKGAGVTPAKSDRPSSQTSGHGCLSDAGHYTYNTAVDALVHEHLAKRPPGKKQHKDDLALDAAVTVDGNQSSSLAETLAAWQRTLQAMDSTSAPVEVVCDVGKRAGEVNTFAACFPLCGESGDRRGALLAAEHTESNGRVRPPRHGIRCATAVAQGYRTQRILCNALREVSGPIRPCDMFVPAWKKSVAAKPQSASLNISNMYNTGLDKAMAAAAGTERMACGTVVGMSTGLKCALDTSTRRSVSTSAALTFTSAAPLMSSPTTMFGLASRTSTGEGTRSSQALSALSSTLSLPFLTPVAPSVAAAADLVVPQPQAARRLSHRLLAVEDWTELPPDLLACSLSLSLRVVRIQRWWRQRLAVRLRREHGSRQRAYLDKEELRDASALRLQRQIRAHWARQALARRAAACAKDTAQRVAAEQREAKHTCSIVDFAGGGLSFAPSSPVTSASTARDSLNRSALSRLEESRCAPPSRQVRWAHTARAVSKTRNDHPSAASRRLNGVAPSAATSLEVNEGRLDVRHPATASVVEVRGGSADRSCERPGLTPTSTLWITAARSSLGTKALQAGTIGDSLLPSTHEASVLHTHPELVNAVAQRIQRCYRSYQTRLHTARCCRDVRVLSAVVTRRASLDAIRDTLDSITSPGCTAEHSEKVRVRDDVCDGVTELSVGVVSVNHSVPPCSPPKLTAMLSTATARQESTMNLDAVGIRSVLDRCTGDVCEAYLRRGFAARRLGDYKTPLERVSLRDLQRIRERRQGKCDKLRHLHERELRQKSEQQQRWGLQALEASTMIQRVGRGWRWRRWLRERQLRAKGCTNHHKVKIPSHSNMNVFHRVPRVASLSLGTQPDISSEKGLCIQLAGGEAVASHIMSNLQAAHPQWFEVAASATPSQPRTLH